MRSQTKEAKKKNTIQHIMYSPRLENQCIPNFLSFYPFGEREEQERMVGVLARSSHLSELQGGLKPRPPHPRLMQHAYGRDTHSGSRLPATLWLCTRPWEESCGKTSRAEM